MSRISQAQNLIRSLAPTPLRTSNSQQLNAALENITNKAFPNASSITAGSREEKALDGMVSSLERLRAGKAMTDVRPPFHLVLWRSLLWDLADVDSTHYQTRRYDLSTTHITTRGSWMGSTIRKRDREGVGGDRSSSSRDGSRSWLWFEVFRRGQIGWLEPG